MDLEDEKNSIIQQPQYAVLVNQFGYNLQRFPVEMIRAHVKNLKEITLNFESDISDFQSDMALRYVNEMIKQWKKKEDDMDDEEIFKMLFG
jgi:hypothetical protein